MLGENSWLIPVGLIWAVGAALWLPRFRHIRQTAKKDPLTVAGFLIFIASIAMSAGFNAGGVTGVLVIAVASFMILIASIVIFQERKPKHFADDRYESTA